MASETASVIVTHRLVRVTVYPWMHPSGREYWRFRRNDGKHVTRASLKDAKDAAKEHAKQIALGQPDLDSLSQETLARLSRMLEVDPDLSLADEFVAWHSKRRPTITIEEAAERFLAAKEKNAGASPHHLRILRSQVAKLPGSMRLVDVGVDDLPEIAGSPRTRANARAAWITFFRWCQSREWLPHNEKTAPERLEQPRIVRTIPATYSPADLRVLLENVQPKYLSWIALCALGGMRTEEIIPQQKSAKDPLRWEDIHLDRRIIIVRPETAKTGHRRVIPVCDRLASILGPIHNPSGRVGAKRYPSTAMNSKHEPETVRLGRFIGGWKRNALRDSFISYRAALVGLGRAAMEAGNSESEAKKSYNDAKSEAEAREWFGLGPGD